MSTGKHIDRICITAIAITLALTILFMNSAALGVVSAERVMSYENRLFDADRVHTMDIVMPDWEGFLETCESETYSACTVLIDGEKFSNIGIRAKGNTSLSSVRSMGSQRYSFKLEFDQYETGKSYHGLDKLCLNNLIQDNTMMKDFLTYQMMAQNGVETPLCSYVYITVNGEDWGLYLAVEGVEDSFLQRNYGSDAGELYKPDSMSFGGGRGNGEGFDMAEFMNSESSEEDSGQEQPGFSGPGGMPGNFPFGGGQMPSFPDGEMPGRPEGEMPEMPGGFGGFGGMGSSDVKLQYIDDDPESYSNIFSNAKTNITKADQTRLISSLKQLNEYTNLENVVNMEEVLRYFVIHNFVVNGDSYTGAMIHNYYLHEQDGMLSMIPWDYNLGFGTFQGGSAAESVNASIDSPVTGGGVDDRPMLGWIFSEEAYTQRYHELFDQFLKQWLENGRLTQLIADTAEMLRPYVEKDPTRFCTTQEYEIGVTAITQFVTLRAEAIRTQLNGDASKVDASELNTSAMGTMNNGGRGPGGDFGSIPEFDNTAASASPGAAFPEGAGTPPDGAATPAVGNAPSFDGATPPAGGNIPPSGGGAPDDGFGASFGGSSGSRASGDSTEAAADTMPPQEATDTVSSAPKMQGNGGMTADRPSGNRTPFPDGNSFSSGQSAASEGAAYLWIGISVVVLAVGLVIARIKKY